MKRSLNGLWPLALLGFFLAQAAHADVIDDVVRGTNLRLNAARIHVRGNDYSTGYWLLPKAAGTLNLNVPARQFGINSDLVLRMYGSRSGNVITWTFNDTLPSPYYLGSANSVTRVRGTLKALARQVRGADDPYCNSAACPHNVELVLTSGSSVFIDGYTDIIWKHYWTEPVAMRQFIAYGGVPRPRLSSMVVTTPVSRCPSPNATELYGDVVLSSPAPTGGILVDLMSVDARVGVLPVRIPEAQRSARFTVRLPPNWTGPTVIYAASGGVRRSVRLSVPECVRKPFEFVRYVQVEYRLALLGLLNGGALVARDRETDSDVFVTAKGETHKLNGVLRAEKVHVVGINTAGDVFGTAYTSKGAHAFRFRSDDVKAEPEVWLDGWEAVTANAHGTLLVRDPHKPEGLFLVDEVGPAPLSLVSKLKTRGLRFNALGEAAVTLETDKGLRAARVYGDKVDVFVETESEIHAVNDVGVFVGAVLEGEKYFRPFIWSDKKELQWLPLPEGFVSAKAVAINDGGWVLGNATADDGKTQTAFLVPPGAKQALRLDDLLPEDLKKAEYRVTRALALADDFGVAVLATDGQGQRVQLVLRP
ncbi:hypothetical protein A176_006425 [Myxococcus hansupus]|uniref:Uncharacterized protein n=1 Tax=Pseudomyxococcus hansupus TaxID=1297742 RepID=A0A0H4X6J2_9BACT|nr:hypothetical protein [Myxococcus hansupus]AKQ69513.1 hypothetical protein A176_006425 [Myxococcus hansupus]